MSGPPTLTESDIIDWFSPKQAIDLLEQYYGSHSYLAKPTLLDRLIAGMVHAVAEHVVINDVGRVTRGKFIPIPASDWRTVRTDNHVWMNGDLIKRLNQTTGEKVTSYFAVRFDPQGIGAIIGSGADPRPPAPDPAASPEIRPGAIPPGADRPVAATAPPINKGGRPPKPFWQEFWIEMCCRVYDGSIHPTLTQAAIQEQMQQWLSDHDYEAGETVLKEAAQRLSRALKARSET
jgi:hypothetical protein